MASTQEREQAIMTHWGEWFGALGDSLVDGGNPSGSSRAIASDGSVTDGTHLL